MPTHHDKLVRDRIPDIIKATGRTPRTRHAAPDEFERYACRKLQEELDEFRESSSTEELVDLMEVIYTIAAARGIQTEELERLRARKARDRGGFDRRLILIEVA